MPKCSIDDSVTPPTLIRVSQLYLRIDYCLCVLIEFVCSVLIKLISIVLIQFRNIV